MLLKRLEKQLQSVRKRGICRLFLLMSMLTVTGCMTLGIKENNQIVFVSPVPIPETINGTPMIMTNKKIPLAILNKPDTNFEQNIGGYVVVDPWFYARLLEAYRRSHGDSSNSN
jgi:hypothetical protein